MHASQLFASPFCYLVVASHGGEREYGYHHASMHGLLAGRSVCLSGDLLSLSWKHLKREKRYHSDQSIDPEV